VLTGELVTLRPVEPGDHPLFTRFRNDVELQLFANNRPPVPLPATTVTERWEQLRTDGDAIGFTIVTTAGGDVIGHCALAGEQSVHRTAELSILIGDRRHWNRGFGREAVRLLVGYGFRYRNLRRVFLETKSTNERAIRAYRAAGFVEEARRRAHIWSDGAYVDLVMMGRLRDDPVG
jgi:RimJ/RimL family protein N-acetyltransferase